MDSSTLKRRHPCGTVSAYFSPHLFINSRNVGLSVVEGYQPFLSILAQVSPFVSECPGGPHVQCFLRIGMNAMFNSWKNEAIKQDELYLL